jgi:hypothetical protein
MCVSLTMPQNVWLPSICRSVTASAASTARTPVGEILVVGHGVLRWGSAFRARRQGVRSGRPDSGNNDGPANRVTKVFDVAGGGCRRAS